MADPKTPFGLTLGQERLRPPQVDYRGVSDRGTADRFGGGAGLSATAKPAPNSPAQAIGDPIASILIGRLHQLTGIELREHFAQPPSAAWAEHTPGFNFKAKNQAALAAEIEGSGRFARVSAKPLTFREVNADATLGSLHVIFRDPLAEIHLDSVAIVRSRDSRTDAPEYTRSIELLLRHLAVDKVGRKPEQIYPW